MISCYHKHMPHTRTTGRARALKAANLFGTLGYIAIIFQWLWALLIICYPFIISDHSFFTPNGQPQPATTPSALSPIAVVVAIIATVAVMCITVVVLVRLPKQIGRQGAKITHHAAEIVMPVITKHRVVPKKKRVTLSYRVILLFKALAIGLPLFCLSFAPSGTPLEPAVMWALGIFCASWSVAYVGLQQLIALAAKLPRDKLW